jgi:hypothetical protein
MLDKRAVVAVASWLWVLGCSGGNHPGFQLPTSPTEAATPPPVYIPPPPRQFPPYEITTIVVGEVITRTNLDAPECLDELNWPCLYFRVTAPGTAMLEVTLVCAKGTQGNQGVDLTLRERGAHAYVWAQSFSQTDTQAETIVTAPVVEGRTYDITMWYTFPNLAYELRTRLR